ncbi:hypothetical protein BST81_13030 [Leptolyngbya sp. 'hensonii']|uniref:hypothetical protein n=1 Tax=Leptolyngbya sp. 'hensonii' TaxID=1922337 RepID=UPI00094F8F5F|nr:hypothetical protein [Leptolyngbya sp. 'hensonii']OLP17968.1 hypothetical protein BST81_13030 [Leptolyngbya sp. 'hensonii']
MLPPTIFYYGCSEPLPEQIPLRAGPLSLIYQAGDLRYIRLGDREILRRVYVAVRVQNWRTIPMTIAHLRTEIHDQSFRITYEASHQQEVVDFVWQAEITGDEQGRIQFTMDGQARSTFHRNRIGFCILHPMRECRSLPCTILKTDGTTEVGVFPDAIAPHQPFMDLQGMAYAVTPGVMAQLRFVGDVFEMEDQRNWTDASFKTYCTPLALPFPVEVQAGKRITQSVELSLAGEPLPSDPPRPCGPPLPGGDATLIVDSTEAVPLPRLGLGMASHGQPLSDREQERLRALHLSHLRVDLPLGKAETGDRLRQATAEARSLNLALELALLLSDDAERELTDLVTLLRELQPPLQTGLIFHREEKTTSGRWIELARRILSPHLPGMHLGAGSFTHFTELNRRCSPLKHLDVLSYAITPQVHAFDNASLVETLEAQATTIASARTLAGDLPLIISPITLKPRPAQPIATPPGSLPPTVDPRQMSLLGAGWTAISLKYLSQPGVHSLTYYETTGWRGVMEQEQGCSCPEQFPSLPGSVFPLYHVLADVGELAPAQVLPTHASHPLQVDGLALCRGDEHCVLVVNLTAATQSVQLQGLGEAVGLRSLDEHTILEAMTTPEAFRQRQEEILQTRSGSLALDLLPHAIGRLRWRLSIAP